MWNLCLYLILAIWTYHQCWKSMTIGWSPIRLYNHNSIKLYNYIRLLLIYDRCLAIWLLLLIHLWILRLLVLGLNIHRLLLISSLNWLTHWVPLWNIIIDIISLERLLLWLSVWWLIVHLDWYFLFKFYIIRRI